MESALRALTDEALWLHQMAPSFSSAGGAPSAQVRRAPGRRASRAPQDACRGANRAGPASGRACPISTGRGMRRVQLVREGGGGGKRARASRPRAPGQVWIGVAGPPGGGKTSLCAEVPARPASTAAPAAPDRPLPLCQSLSPAARPPAPPGVRDAACPISTRGGTRLVRLVRGRGGGHAWRGGSRRAVQEAQHLCRRRAGRARRRRERKQRALPRGAVRLPSTHPRSATANKDHRRSGGAGGNRVAGLRGDGALEQRLRGGHVRAVPGGVSD
jgi:hypothetical protein